MPKSVLSTGLGPETTPLPGYPVLNSCPNDAFLDPSEHHQTTLFGNSNDWRFTVTGSLRVIVFSVLLRHYHQRSLLDCCTSECAEVFQGFYRAWQRVFRALHMFQNPKPYTVSEWGFVGFKGSLCWGSSRHSRGSYRFG